jgi:hypothetical protein
MAAAAAAAGEHSPGVQERLATDLLPDAEDQDPNR